MQRAAADKKQSQQRAEYGSQTNPVHGRNLVHRPTSAMIKKSIRRNEEYLEKITMHDKLKHETFSDR
jgi:hypothetical protein